MTDRELLEAAAKAAGVVKGSPYGSIPYFIRPGHEFQEWKPLDDDGDAFRLAVRLCLRVEPTLNHGVAFRGSVCAEMFSEPVNGDPYAATRRAIVRAAASLGERGKT